MVNGYMPKTLKEALEIRAEHDVIPYSGGTDLMVICPKDPTYLFLGGLDEIKQITEDEQFIRIGAGVTFTRAMKSELVPDIMKKALSFIASPAVRNAGTFGGNLGNASDKADSVVVELAMDVLIRVQSQSGERIIPVDRFCRGRKDIDLKKDEIITEVLLPKEKRRLRYYYENVGGRNSLAISHVVLAGLFDVKEGVVTDFSCAFIADTATALRFKEIEKNVVNRTTEDVRNHPDDILGAYDESIVLAPRGRVSGAYRKAVCMNLLRDYLSVVIKD